MMMVGNAASAHTLVDGVHFCAIPGSACTQAEGCVTLCTHSVLRSHSVLAAPCALLSFCRRCDRWQHFKRGVFDLRMLTGRLHMLCADVLDPKIWPRAKFISEFGFQSWPSWQLYQQVTEPADWARHSDMSEFRCLATSKL